MNGTHWTLQMTEIFLGHLHVLAPTCIADRRQELMRKRRLSVYRITDYVYATVAAADDDDDDHDDVDGEDWPHVAK